MQQSDGQRYPTCNRPIPPHQTCLCFINILHHRDFLLFEIFTLDGMKRHAAKHHVHVYLVAAEKVFFASKPDSERLRVEG
jgi:hypothetical protein